MAYRNVWYNSLSELTLNEICNFFKKLQARARNFLATLQKINITSYLKEKGLDGATQLKSRFALKTKKTTLTSLSHLRAIIKDPRRRIALFVIIAVSSIAVAFNVHAKLTNEIAFDFEDGSIASRYMLGSELETVEADHDLILQNAALAKSDPETAALSPNDFYEEETTDESYITPRFLIEEETEVIQQETEEAERTKLAYHIYTVQDGDTLSSIAKKNGISAETLVAENEFKETVVPGQNIVIPNTSGITHKVAKDQTASSIAMAYGAETQDIIEANKLGPEGIVQPGEIIVVPGGKKAEPIPKLETKQNRTPATKKVKQKMSRRIASRERERQLASTYEPSETPAGTDTSSSGNFGSPTSYSSTSRCLGKGHQGCDLIASTGTPVYAADGGTVTRAENGYNGGYGTVIYVTHANGYETRYAHLSAINIESGQKIGKGQIIGKVGNTGRSTGSHLHYELRKNGQPTNPL